MIILTTQCFPPRRGGIETLMHALAEALTKQKLIIEVWADAEHGVNSDDFDHGLCYKVKRHGGFKPWRRRKKAAAVAAALEAGQCGAVIADTWKSIEHLDTTSVAPIICLAHGTELTNRRDTRKVQRIRNTFQKATRIVANSAYTANLAMFFASAEKISIIHPGIAAPLIQLATNTSQVRDPHTDLRRTIISVARLEPRKGIDTVISVLPQLLKGHPGLRYIVVGDGSQKRTLEQLAQNLGVQAHVSFKGSVSDEERNALLAHSDLFVLPGRAVGADVEGFGIGFIEAAWFGLPAIAGRVGGAHEAVIHEHTGLVCDGVNSQEVFNAIHRLLSDHELRSQLGENARDRAQSFLWPQVICEYLPLLRPL